MKKESSLTQHKRLIENVLKYLKKFRKHEVNLELIGQDFLLDSFGGNTCLSKITFMQVETSDRDGEEFIYDMDELLLGDLCYIADNIEKWIELYEVYKIGLKNGRTDFKIKNKKP